MQRPNILVVEDERILAEDLRDMLESLDYRVVGIVESGEKAIKDAFKLKPDLITMDIMLRGRKDGIVAAHEIRQKMNVPVVFLTAYADESTLQRAKLAEPFGYILKPYKEQDIHTAIQVALYKHQMDARVRNKEKWFSSVLVSIGDAVIATDVHGKVKFMNPVAEAITGWKLKDALGLDSEIVLKIIDEKTGKARRNPLTIALDEEDTIYSDEVVLAPKRGRQTHIKDSAAPIHDDDGALMGAVMIFRDGRKKSN
jgi:PAS domain S-box-containing protein